MDLHGGKPCRKESQEGLQVVLQSPHVDQLIVDERSKLEGRFPPSEILLDLAQHFPPRVNLKCAECKVAEPNIKRLVFCPYCDRCFHPNCWTIYEDHTPNTSRGEPCQSYTRLDVHLWMKYLHSPRGNEDELLQQLRQDRPHRWLGVADHIDQDKNHTTPKPKLLLYAALTKQFTIAGPTPHRQFPRLVSFFGDSGKGKSTVVQNLIRNIAYSKAKAFETPVVGVSTNSTSGGIHVYCDPESFQHQRPIVYADCEGPAGDLRPLANRLDNNFYDTHGRHIASQIKAKASEVLCQKYVAYSVNSRGSQPSLVDHQFQSQIPVPISVLDLPWIEKMDVSSSGASQWSDTVVSRIYPRLLYVFSDVVCYISNDLKAAEHDMARLVDWANEARDFTTNQGVKPSLIFIINQDNNSDFTRWRDSKYATEELLKKLRCSKRFISEQLRWRDRGAIIETADQLLRCYYRDVSVVFLPQFLPGRTLCSAGNVQGQYDTLYGQIDRKSLVSSEKRRETNLLFDLEAFSRNSVRVVEQLAKDPHCSLDLKNLAEPLREQPTNFILHVLNLLRRLQTANEKLANDNDCVEAPEARLIKSALPYLTVCVAGEVMRAQARGSNDNDIPIFGERWRQVLARFGEEQCRCGATFRGQRCRNFKDRHFHGHQFALGDAGRVRAGDFESRFSESVDGLHKAFCKSVRNHVVLRPRSGAKWADELSKESQICSIGKIISNRTCLACLSRTPIHVAPCGHSICEICVADLSVHSQDDATLLKLKRCPVGCQWSSGKSFQIRRKPAEAGVRVLSLDGGGVRGVVELVVLEAIMERVGHDLPIQELFDVITGTSTGGIIALGIFKKKWTIAKATRNFEELVKCAFATRGFLRPWIELPGVHLCAQLVCKSLFKSEGINSALCTAFDSRTLLFGPPSNHESDINKTAVIATGDEEETPVLLTTYNREWRISDKDRDIMRREEEPAHELKVWEAARCTSAAPTYFEPYKHPETGRIYVDGALERNNPVRLADDERRFIWPKPAEHNRDIIVSIGTGLSTDYDGMPEKDQNMSAFLQGLQKVGLVRNLIILKSVLQSTLNCQKKWHDFMNSQGTDEQLLARCHRINIPYGAGQSLCGLDEWRKLEETKSEALNVLSGTSVSVRPFVQDQLHDQLDTVARQLTASLFYLAIHALDKSNSHNYDTYHGRIRCRLGRSYEMQFLSLRRKNPAFRIIDSCNQEYSLTLSLSGWDATTFSRSAQLVLPKETAAVRVEVNMDNGRHWDTISGFPRIMRVPTT